jgi:hypothetical protein
LTTFRLKLLLLVVAVMAAFEHARLARMVARAVTNGDTTLLWYTAREWGAFHPRQPNFYGQSYGSSIEAVPMELVRRLGAPPWSATTLVWGGLAVLGWLLLALAAWRTAHRVLAALAVTAPALLGAYYTFVVTTVAEHQGAHFLVVAGAAVLIMRSRRVGVEATGLSLLGVGMLMERGGSLLGAPVAIWYLLSAGVTRRRVVSLALGALAPAAYLLWWWSFYRAHPDYTLFGGTSLRPGWAVLRESIGHLDRFFALFVLELAPHWQLAIAATLVLVLMLVATRELKYLVPGLIVPLLLVWGMATPRARGDLGPFLSPARLFVTLPYVLWFLAFLVGESGVLRRLPRPRRLRLPARLPSVVVAGLVGLALISVALRQVEYDDRVVALRDRATVAVYGFHTKTKDVVTRCAQLSAAAHSTHASIIVFTDDAAMAYGCGALDYGRTDTLLANDERRTWRLYEERRRTRSAAVLAGVHPGYCGYAGPRVDRCRPVAPDAVELTFPSQSVLGLLAMLNVPVRPFGPNCHPDETHNCSNHLLPSVADLRTGAPPRDEAAARRDIDQAFAEALNIDGGFATVEDGSSISAKVRPNRHAYEMGLARAQVLVDGIHFLNARQAAVDLQILRFAQSNAFRGWAIERDGSWQVDRNTFCSIELYFTSKEQWCSPS